MRYDLDILFELCGDIGLPARMADCDSLEVVLGAEAVLRFQNDAKVEDCLVGFLGTPWHFHGDLMFSDPSGNFIELGALKLLEGLRSGDVLVCEQTLDGNLADRWLVHKEYNDEFRHVRLREQLIFHRACVEVPQSEA